MVESEWCEMEDRLKDEKAEDMEIVNPSITLDWNVKDERIKKLKKACESASRLIYMNEDDDSIKAWRILDKAIKD